MRLIAKRPVGDRWELAIALAGALVCLVGFWPVSHWAETRALAQLQERSGQLLSLVTEAMRGALVKHESTPALLARNPALSRSLDAAASREEIQTVNKELAQFAEVTGALDIYLLNAEGSTVATSNWAAPHSFVGLNFNYRPYFKQAMKGKPWQYFALGTTSKKRGYYFASPVRNGVEVTGVVVTKIGVEELEKAWRTATDYEVRIVDGDGVIFLSSNPKWVLKTLAPLSEEALKRLSADRRYDGQPLTALASATTRRDGVSDIVTIWDDALALSRKGLATSFLVQEAAMPSAGWSVQVLARMDGAASYVNWARALFLVTVAALSLASLNILQRRKRLRDHLALHEHIRAELEHSVAERTGELRKANKLLSAEVEERRRTEAELLCAQAELVHAGKLAALGQMSAGLSHELNQPLAAIRSYAENCQVFLDRGQSDTVKSNLGAIAELTERMARIIRDLRTYARKAPLTLEPACAARAIREAIALIGSRLGDVAVRLDLPPGEVLVAGGGVRLQQVFVNLFGNAIDAMKTSPRRELHVALIDHGESVVITVRDTGPGVPEQDLSSVFDPFFTTKPVGEGLGLGLSITYGIIKQFGGCIDAGNHEDGGAVFTVRLKAAKT
jgi:two-component system, NtrC family, C4-dicarboxylate transport sensor histidine kinase DctB